MYRQCTYKYNACICNVYTCIYWIYLIVNRVSGSTEGCRTEGFPLSCHGGWGWGQSLSRRWWIYGCKAWRCRNGGGHGKLVNGLENQERSGYHELHSLLSKLPVPVANSGMKMSHAAALEGWFLSKMSEEEQKLFTPTELLLWRHAVEYRYMSM